MTRRSVFIVAFALALSREAEAQDAVSPAELQAAVTTLAKAVSGEREGGSLKKREPPSERLVNATRWLQNNAKSAKGVSRAYVRSLERAARLLSQSPSEEVVEDVTLDLELKVQHCRTLGVGMGGTVLLKVNTRRGGLVVSDWQVLYLLKFDEFLKTDPRSFLRVTSPADMNLEPGRYRIWALDPATGKTSNRVLVDVGGQKELTLDLPVP
jgi:hypothetical protein